MKLLDRLIKSKIFCLAFLVIISLLPRLTYFFMLLYSGKGLPMATDTPVYLQQAKALLESFSIRMHFNDILYLGYTVILALLLLIFRTNALIVFAQLVINAFCVILVYNISEMLFNRRTAFISGLLYAFTWPLIFWSMFVLSDSLFVSLLLVTVYLLLKCYSSPRKLYKYLFSASCIYMLLFRPTGLISVAFILIYVLINMDRLKAKEFIKRRKVVITASVLTIAGAFVVVAFSGILTPLYNSTRYFVKWILYNIYANGQIFDIKAGYQHKFDAVLTVNYFNSPILSFFINNWKNIIILYIRRSIFFWAFNLMNFNLLKLYLLFTYLTGAMGVFFIIKNHMLKKSSILLLVILSIMLFCILVFMDSAFRYRMPVYIFLNIIAAYGFDRCIELAGRRIKLLKGRTASDGSAH